MVNMILPTLKEISNRIKGQLSIDRDYITGDSVFADVMASNFLLMEKQINDMAKDFSPYSARPLALETWGNVFGLKRKQATFTLIKASFTPEEKGKVEFKNESKIRTDNYDEFVFYGKEEDDFIFISTKTGPIKDIEKDRPVYLVETMLGVKSNGLIKEIITLGQDIESIESFRDRIIERINSPTMGGNNDDYIRWMKELPFCTDSWIYSSGVNIGICFLCKNRPKILPTEKEIQEAQDHINKKRPVTAFVKIFMLDEAKKVIIPISGVEQDKVVSINVSFLQFLKDRAEPGLGLSYFDIQKFLIKDVGLDNFKVKFDEYKISKTSVLIDGEFSWTKNI